MATQTSINITVLNTENKKATKAITYVNPQATNAQLEAAATLFTAISQNTYQSAERIDRTDLTGSATTQNGGE